MLRLNETVLTFTLPTFPTSETLNPNPTFFQTGSAREPYHRGQWGSALRATPQATMGEITDGWGPADNLCVHVPTVSSLAGLAGRLVT